LDHETEFSQLADLSSAGRARQRERPHAGWRRNALILVGAIAFMAALKLLASA
jgi:hypothetical protein